MLDWAADDPAARASVARFFRRRWGLGVQRGVLFALDAGALFHELVRALLCLQEAYASVPPRQRLPVAVDMSNATHKLQNGRFSRLPLLIRTQEALSARCVLRLR